jgi:hypothetical protein
MQMLALNIDMTSTDTRTVYESGRRITRLIDRHMCFGGRFLPSAKPFVAYLDHLIKTDYKMYDAIRNCGEYFFKSGTRDRYADGRWMKEAKERVAFKRYMKTKYGK